MAKPATLLLWALLGCECGCGARTGLSTDVSTVLVDADAGGDVTDAPGDAAKPNPGCTTIDEKTFVVTSRGDLQRFEPTKLEFSMVGRLRCSSASSPISMGIDRKGTAWVMFTDGSLFEVSTADASCKSTAFEPRQLGFDIRGMSFASAGPSSTREVLFVSDRGGKGLGWIDFGTLRLAGIGVYGDPLRGTHAELTGTGDGRLYGFFRYAKPPRLAEIDQVTAEIRWSRDLSDLTLEATDGYAVSFWGGDFWLYSGEPHKVAVSSRVTRYHPATDSLEVVMKDLGFSIVGAGVSLCAPLGR